MELTLEEGSTLVKYVRDVIELSFKEKVPDIWDYVDDEMKEVITIECAAHITLFKHPNMNFRGSAGHILPIFTLERSLKELATHAAFRDSRTIPLMKAELHDTLVELSLLKRPERIKTNPDKIKIGRDGVAVEKGYMRSLILPQIPMRRNWSSQETISYAMVKAGLDPKSDMQDIILYRLNAQVFIEEEPGGKVKEVDLRK